MTVKPGHQRFVDVLVQDLMWEAKKKEFTLDDLANAVGPSRRTMENYQYGARPTLDGFFGLFRTIQPVDVARKIACSCGGYFLKPNSTRGLCSRDLTKHTSAIMKETADVLNVVATSLNDNSIQQGKKRAIDKEVDEAIEALLLLKVRIESEESRDKK